MTTTTEVTPAMLSRIEAGSTRLYQRDFFGTAWLADWVADVDSVCMAYEQRCAELADYKAGAEEEARAGDEARTQVAQLREQVAQLTSANERPSPIPLNSGQEKAAREWAADDRLWTTQETVEANLRTFARTILKLDSLDAAVPS